MGKLHLKFSSRRVPKIASGSVERRATRSQHNNETNLRLAMVEYDLTMLSDPRLFGLIAAHGMVDFAVPPSLLAIYALAAVPLGSIPTTASFCALSLMHFGRDMDMLGERRGMLLSVVLHSLVGLVYLWNKDVAFSLMMLYSLVWHIPGDRPP